MDRMRWPCAERREEQDMDGKGGACPYEKLYGVQFDSLKEDLEDLKIRVGRVEATVARGITLLVANLAGVILTLLRQLL